MDRARFTRGSAARGPSMVVVQTKKPSPSPDLTDFMNDMFFGTISSDNKSYNLTGNSKSGKWELEEEKGFDDSMRSESSKLTQEWLHEARRMVASSPSRCDSPAPTKLVGSPRFASARLSTGSTLDRRDPLSRSARRNRATEGFSEEILTRSARHTRNGSSVSEQSAESSSPTSQVHKWISNNIKPPNGSSPEYQLPKQNNNNTSLVYLANDSGLPLPPRQSTHRRSRFQAESPQPQSQPHSSSSPQDIPRRFKHHGGHVPAPPPRSGQVLSPPKNLVESAHRRSISKSTCSIEKIAPNQIGHVDEASGEQDLSLNGFLKKQRTKAEQIMNKEIDGKAKIILSGPSNSTSSMVAAICYAWLLENKEVILIASRFQVEFENLMMSGQLNILVVGQDILRTNGEVGSQCTILTDNYCEDAYDLLEFQMLKKLLLAGILLDTQNLNSAVELSTTRDSEAVQLLLVGSPPNYRTTIYDQLVQEQKDHAFLEALRHYYGKPPSSESGRREKNSSNSSQNESSKGDPSRTGCCVCTAGKQNGGASRKAGAIVVAKHTNSESTRGKNKFSISKWFGFGGK
ncbi:hypothetical protein LINPERPRIM_LOCUS3962 [Linum perenne]